MNSLKRNLLKIAVILCMVTSLSSCVSSLERKLTIESYDNLKVAGFTAAKVDLGIRNESCHNVTLKECQITLREGTKRIAVATLKEGFKVPGHSPLVMVPTAWRIGDLNPIAALQLSSRLLNKNANFEFVVDIEGKAKISLINRKFTLLNIPLQSLLNEIE
ncbi:MAG: hypothetical protein R3Y08_03900 [Rikenellaceae bacterium]